MIHIFMENRNKKQILLKVSLAVILIFLSLSPGYASENKGVAVQSSQLNLVVKQASLKELFDLIKTQSDYNFVYSNNVINDAYRITLNLKNVTLDEGLKEALKNTGLTYIVKNKQVMILPVTTQSSKRKITGTVYDNEGITLPGVNIVVQGTQTGATTDVDGNFVLEVRDSDVLEVSFVGMKKQIVQIGKSKDLAITMEADASNLEEVTIVAFAKQKKSSMVASITTIDPGELKVPASNLTTAMAGRIAGMISYQTSGEPGKDDASFFIRGITTFGTGKTDPLILIDNIEMSSTDLARMQPDDIASFSVMKDATAAALYGSRGANGVILVTTKVGVEGRARMSVRFENTFSSPTETVQVGNPITYMRLHNEAVKTRNPLGIVPYSDSKIANTIAGINSMAFPTTDWQEMMFKDFTSNQRFNFNISGGGKAVRYYVSGTFNQDNGVLKVDKKNNFNNNINLKNYLVRANINMDLTSSTELVVRTHGQFDDYNGPIVSGTDLYKRSIWSNPVMFPAVYEPDQAHLKAKNTLFGGYKRGDKDFINPYADLVSGYKDYATSKMLVQVELKQKLNFITKGLNFRLLGNTDRYSWFDVSRQYTPYKYEMSSYDRVSDTYTLKALNEGSEALGYSEGGKVVNSTLYMEAAVDYSRTFKEKHDVGGLLVYMLRESLTANAGNLQSSLPSRNLGLAGRLTYGYDNRYMFEFNFGYNGSERFAKRERYGFFPSLGIGWNLANESFYSDRMKEVMPKLKFKATYGLVGNDQIGDTWDRFFYLSQVNLNDGDRGYNFGTKFDYRINGISMTRYANDLISWETAYKTNLGVELNVLGKLEVQADVFFEKRTNILMERSDIPTTMGLVAKPRANVGKASGNGFEVSLDYTHSFPNQLWLIGRGTFTYATGRFDLYEEPNYSLDGTPWRAKTGQKIGQRWGYVAERLFVDEADIKNSPQQTFGEYLPGDIKYKDINDDGIVNNKDMVPIGYPENAPEIIYGFGLSGGYKNFDLSFYFQGSARSSFWIDPRLIQPFNNGGQNALLQVVADSHWSEENRDLFAFWPRLSDYEVGNNIESSTWWMRNGAFIRLKNVEMGYTFPTKWTEKAWISKMRLYVNGMNLLAFSKFKMWDPEMRGDGLGYPIQRMFNAGIQIDF